MRIKALKTNGQITHWFGQGLTIEQYIALKRAFSELMEAYKALDP